jgi:hypothetical protein
MATGRGEVILAGYIIMHEVLQHLDAPSYLACERDILDGASLAAAELAIAHDLRELPEPFGRTVC